MSKKHIVTVRDIPSTTDISLKQLGFEEIKNQDQWPTEVPLLTGDDISTYFCPSKAGPQSIASWAVSVAGASFTGITATWLKLLWEVTPKQKTKQLNRSYFLLLEQVSPAAQAKLWNLTMQVLGYTEVSDA